MCEPMDTACKNFWTQAHSAHAYLMRGTQIGTTRLEETPVTGK